MIVLKKSIAPIITFILLCSHLLCAQQSTSAIKLSHYLKNVSQEHRIYFAFPTVLLDNIMVANEQKSFQEIQQFLPKLLKNNGIDCHKIDDYHFLLRKLEVEKKTQSVKTISSIIIDEETGEPLEGAVVYTDNYTAVDQTKADGRFSIKVKDNEANQKVIVSFVGYSEKKLDIKTLQSAKPIKLAAASKELAEVTITQLVPVATIDNKSGAIKGGASAINHTQAGALFGNDLMRNLQLLPGVAAYADNNVGLKIRGSNSDAALVMLDAMPIYKTEHYYGLISNINPLHLSGYMLYKNSLPIEQIGATSGMLNVWSTKNDLPENATIFNLNTFYTALGSRIRLSKNVNLTLSGRSTNGDLGKSPFLNQSTSLQTLMAASKNNYVLNAIEPSYHFYDFQGKLNVKVTEKDRLSINMFRSKDDQSGSSSISVPLFQNVVISKSDNQEESYSNMASSVQYSHQYSNSASIQASAYISKFNKTDNRDSYFTDRHGQDIDTFFINSYFKESIVDKGLNLGFQNDKVKFGLSTKQYESVVSETIKEQSIFDVDQKAVLNMLYGSYNLKIGEHTVVDLGTRLAHYKQQKNEFAFLPQLTMVHSLNANHQLKASVSKQKQYLRDINFENPFGVSQTFRTLANDSIPPLSATNFMIGYTYVKQKWSFDAEVFAKYISNAIELLPKKIPMKEMMGGPNEEEKKVEYLRETGKTTVYGIDLMATYTSSSYQTLLSYTLSKATNRFDKIYDGTAYPNANDRRHQLKWSNTYRWNKFEVNGNFIFASGRPYLHYELVNEQPRDNNSNTNAIGYLPAYIRVDAGVKYNFSLWKKEASFGFGVFNLLDRKNYAFIQYNVNKRKEDNADNNVVGSTSPLIGRSLTADFILKF